MGFWEFSGVTPHVENQIIAELKETVTRLQIQVCELQSQLASAERPFRR